VTRQVPTSFDIVYTSTTTGCTDTLSNGATISPAPNVPILTLSPNAFTPFSATITPGDPGPPVVPPTVSPSQPQTLTVVNSGTGTLTVQSVTQGASCSDFTISAPPTPSPLGTCDQFPISATYNGTTAPSTQQCTLTVVTSAGTRTLTLTGNSR
jgi:hypothetical protein